MPSHMHLLARSKENDLSGVLRDFKSFTSKKLIDAIANNRHESRRQWMLKIFREQGEKNSRNEEFQFWRQDNQPKVCYSDKFTVQKLDYIHNNPVAAGIVELPHHYLYSSAIDYYHSADRGLLKVDFI